MTWIEILGFVTGAASVMLAVRQCALMTTRFEERLAERQVPWIKVSGTPAKRLESAIERIDRMLQSNSL
jgi:hypothetical protein